MMHLSMNDLIALGVALNLVALAAKAVFKSPKQQAQIDAIEGKVNDVLNHVVQYLPVDPPLPPPPAAPTGVLNAGVPNLALQPLPVSKTVSAQGGAS